MDFLEISVFLFIFCFPPYLLHLFLKRFKFYWTFWNGFYDDGKYISGLIYGVFLIGILLLLIFGIDQIVGALFMFVLGLGFYFFFPKKEKYILDAMWKDYISTKGYEKTKNNLNSFITIYIIVCIIAYFYVIR
tara:strand:+ start:286 stop:684 length:399 start_codon:yes stop_codon:yes gene_type:complete